MTQPEYVPTALADRVREQEKLPAHKGWKATRPADAVVPGAPQGLRMGRPGPDQGYALRLARRFRDRIKLAPGEKMDDAVAGSLAVAMQRAALFGRAPVIYDVEHAFELWGFLGKPPAELADFRDSLFRGAGHNYFSQRDIVDAVPESTLRMTPAQVREQVLAGWSQLFNR